MSDDSKNTDLSRQENIIAFVSDGVTQQIMMATLSSLNIMNCQSMVGEIKDAIAYLTVHRSPKILVVDISNSELPMSDMQQLAEVCEPGTFLVVLGTRNDIGLFRNLLRLGVADYVTKPINVDFMAQTLLSTIRGDTDTVAQQRVGKIVAVIGSRGGVGSTTVATNIAWILSNERFKRTMLVDLDLHFGNAPLLMDLKIVPGLKETLANPDRIDQTFFDHSVLKHNERLMMIGSTETLEQDAHFHPDSFDALLPIIRNEYHYVIVDVPRVMNELTHSVLNYAGNVFIVTDLSLAGVRDTARILELLGPERARHKAFVIANSSGRYDRGEITRDEYQKAINHSIDFIIPHDGHSGLVAANMGKSLASITSISGLNNVFRQIVDQITGSGQAGSQVVRSTEWGGKSSNSSGSNSSSDNSAQWDDVRKLLGDLFKQK